MVLPERTKQHATQVVDLTDIRQFVKENNYGYSPLNSQAARGRHGKSHSDYSSTLILMHNKPANSAELGGGYLEQPIDNTQVAALLSLSQYKIYSDL